MKKIIILILTILVFVSSFANYNKLESSVISENYEMYSIEDLQTYLENNYTTMSEEQVKIWFCVY